MSNRKIVSLMNTEEGVIAITSIGTAALLLRDVDTQEYFFQEIPVETMDSPEEAPVESGGNIIQLFPKGR